MKIPIPCENCITLSMCKATLNNATTDTLMKLTDKCCVLFKFMYFNQDDATPFVRYPNIPYGSPRQMRYNQLEYNITLLGETLLKDIPFHHSSGYLKLTVKNR